MRPELGAIPSECNPRITTQRLGLPPVLSASPFATPTVISTRITALKNRTTAEYGPAQPMQHIWRMYKSEGLGGVLDAAGYANASEWQVFMRDVVGLLDELLPWVQRAVRGRHWTCARDPVECVRKVAQLAAKRAQETASGGKEEGKG